MKITMPDLDTEDRGVSPVIGVILMVAITVILAAVIGAFVLDLGSQLGSTGPQTQLTVSDNSVDVSAATDTEALVDVTHKGGDTLAKSDLKIIVVHGGTSYTVAGGGITTNLGTELAVGESFTISEGGAALSDALGAGGEVTVKVVHEPSQSVITSTKVEVN